MAEYKCTNYGGCSKYNQVVTESGANPSCSECGTTLSPYLPPQSFWSRSWKQIISGVGLVIVAFVGMIFPIPSLIIKPSPTDGTIVSQDEKKTINCGSVCENSYSKHTQITLKAQPKPNFKFDSWKGDCKDTKEAECQLTMDGDRTVEAVFIPDSPPPPPPTPIPGHENELQADMEQNIKQYISQGMSEVNFAQMDSKNKTQHYSNAVEKFKRAIESSNDCTRFPELSAVYSNLGSIYLETRKPGLAFENYQSARECNPHDSLLQYNFAMYHLNQKQEDLALEALDKALELGIEKRVSDNGQNFCDFLKQDFKKINEKLELETVLNKYKVSCK